MDPIRPEVFKEMRDIGNILSNVVPKTHVFVLMIADIGEGGHTSYMSNGNREDIIKLMEEFIIKIKEAK